MQIHESQVFEFISDGEKFQERVIGFTSNGKFAWLVETQQDKGFPYKRRISTLLDEIDDEIRWTLDYEPFEHILWEDNAFSDRQKKDREENMHIIQPLIDAGQKAYGKKHRTKLVRMIEEETGYTGETINQLYRRYLQRGSVPNSVIPDFSNCGGAGQMRITFTSDAKRGTPSNDFLGINMVDEAWEVCARTLWREYRRRDARKLTDIRRDILAQYFSEENETSRWDPNIEYPVLLPYEECLTYDQLYYLRKKIIDIEDRLRSHYGQTYYMANFRPKLGTSRDHVWGPGSVFQIDATPPNIYLVSNLNNMLPYKPGRLWFVRDVWSGLIVGMSFSLEAESYLGGMMALENAFTSKVDFCAQYDIHITDNDWPYAIPDTLVVDGGVMSKSQSKHLSRTFGINVQKTPFNRPDLKGDVEVLFNIADNMLFKWMPSFRRWPYGRGGGHPALEARYTYKAAVELLIIHVLEYNHYARISKFPVSNAMIKDDVDLNPLPLWHWGIRNITGAPRTKPKRAVQLGLLPTATATVTQNGIRFEGLTYTCELAEEEKWFDKAAYEGSWDIQIAHDPRTVNWIYLKLESGKIFEVCSLIDNKRNRTFFNMTLWDVKRYRAHRRKKDKLAGHQRDQSIIREKAHTDAANKRQQIQYEQHKDDRSDNQRLKDRDKTYQAERDRKRREAAYTPDEAHTVSSVQQEDEGPSDESTLTRPDISSTIRDILNKRKGKDNDSV